MLKRHNRDPDSNCAGFQGRPPVSVSAAYDRLPRSTTALRHAVGMRDQFIGGESMITNNVNCCQHLPHRTPVLGSHGWEGQRGHDSFAGAIFTDAVVEVFQTFLRYRGTAVVRSRDSPTRTPEASRFCFGMSSFTDLLPEKVMLAMAGRSFT